MKQRLHHPLCCLALLFLTAFMTNYGFAQEQKAAFGPCSPEIESKIASAVSASNYKEALDATDQLEQQAEIHSGKESRCYGAALSEHAAILQLLNRGIELQPIFERAVGLLREYSSPQDPKFALALNNYGVSLYWMRRYQESARVHEEALDVRRRLQPPDPAAVAESLHNLADTYRYLDRQPEDVKKLYEDALNIKMNSSCSR